MLKASQEVMEPGAPLTMRSTRHGHCLVPPSCSRTYAPGVREVLGVPGTPQCLAQSLPTAHVMGEWILHAQTHIANLHCVSPWCYQANAVFHTEEAPSVWSVAGWMPALVESTEQHALASSWQGALSVSPSATHFCTLSG